MKFSDLDGSVGHKFFAVTPPQSQIFKTNLLQLSFCGQFSKCKLYAQSFIEAPTTVVGERAVVFGALDL